MVNGEVGDVRREVVSCHRQNGMHAAGSTVSGLLTSYQASGN
jgi:hypothetical protein